MSRAADIAASRSGKARTHLAVLAGSLLLLVGLALGGVYWVRHVRARQASAFEHAERGVERYEARHYTEAVAEFRKATELDPDNPRAWFMLGRTERQADPVKGIPSLARATKLDAANAEYWHEYGIALRDADRIAEARDALSRASSLDPTTAEVHMDLARAYLVRITDPSDHDRGIQELRTALKLIPGDINARFRLATALYQADQIADARREFETTLGLLAEGARQRGGKVDGGDRESSAWISLVRGCHYHLWQIAYRQRRDDDARRQRQAQEEMREYITSVYSPFETLKKNPKDAPARAAVERIFAHFGLPPGGPNPEQAIDRWITHYQK